MCTTLRGPDPTRGPAPYEYECDDCGCFSPIGEPCWRCEELFSDEDES